APGSIAPVQKFAGQPCPTSQSPPSQSWRGKKMFPSKISRLALGIYLFRKKSTLPRSPTRFISLRVRINRVPRMLPHLYSLDEVADLLRLKPETLRKFCSRIGLNPIKSRPTLLFTNNDLSTI